jgi:hypothetical protein
MRRPAAPAVLALATLLAAGCSHPDYGPRKAGKGNVTVSFVDAAAEPPPLDAAPAAATSTTPLAFADVAGALARACDAAGPSLEQGAACRQGAMQTAMARLADGGADLARHQAAWARYVDAACALVEETFWLDLDAGRRDDGLHDPVAWPTCRGSAFTERVFYARALDGGDVTALARWIQASTTRGEVSRRKVAQLRAGIDALAARDAGPALDGGAFVPGPPDAAPAALTGSGKYHVLDEGDEQRLLRRITFVQSMPASLARETCSLFPDLASALGGDPECQDEVALYYFAHAQYGRVY